MRDFLIAAGALIAVVAYASYHLYKATKDKGE